MYENKYSHTYIHKYICIWNVYELYKRIYIYAHILSYHVKQQRKTIKLNWYVLVSICIVLKICFVVIFSIFYMNYIIWVVFQFSHDEFRCTMHPFVGGYSSSFFIMSMIFSLNLKDLFCFPILSLTCSNPNSIGSTEWFHTFKLVFLCIAIAEVNVIINLKFLHGFLGTLVLGEFRFKLRMKLHCDLMIYVPFTWAKSCWYFPAVITSHTV